MSDFVMPTRIAVHRYQQMKVEAIVNTPYQVTGDQSPLQACMDGAGIDDTLDLLKLDDDEAEIAQDLLEDALGGGDIDETYGPRGGVLCLLFPTADPSADFVFEVAVQEAPGAMTMNAFVNAPNELFSALTPAEVWAGAGKIEMELAQVLLENLWDQFKDEDFRTPGAANTAWLGKLRLWSYNPTNGHRGRVIDIIRDERGRNLTLRREHCAANGIETVFAALDE
jgi:hypothetical protein